MPHRDPETGQFVSGDKPSGFDRWDSVHGGLVWNIPAADANGSTQNEQVSTAESTIVDDFDDLLDQDETFHMAVMYLSVEMHMTTTATAEGSGVCGYAVTTRNFNPVPLLTRPTALDNLPAIDFSDGIVDGAKATREDDDILVTGTISAEPSWNDTVQTVSGGSSPYRESRTIAPLRDQGRYIKFDDDDELYIQGELGIENVSDHGTTVSWQASLHGWVEERD